jgi:hypothetical protein
VFKKKSLSHPVPVFKKKICCSLSHCVKEPNFDNRQTNVEDIQISLINGWTGRKWEIWSLALNDLMAKILN